MNPACVQHEAIHRLHKSPTLNGTTQSLSQNVVVNRCSIRELWRKISATCKASQLSGFLVEKTMQLLSRDADSGEGLAAVQELLKEQSDRF